MNTFLGGSDGEKVRPYAVDFHLRFYVYDETKKTNYSFDKVVTRILRKKDGSHDSLIAIGNQIVKEYHQSWCDCEFLKYDNVVRHYDLTLPDDQSSLFQYPMFGVKNLKLQLFGCSSVFSDTGNCVVDYLMQHLYKDPSKVQKSHLYKLIRQNDVYKEYLRTKNCPLVTEMYNLAEGLPLTKKRKRSDDEYHNVLARMDELTQQVVQRYGMRPMDVGVFAAHYRQQCFALDVNGGFVYMFRPERIEGKNCMAFITYDGHLYPITDTGVKRSIAKRALQAQSRVEQGEGPGVDPGHFFEFVPKMERWAPKRGPKTWMDKVFMNTWETAIVNPTDLTQYPNSYVVYTTDRINHVYDTLILAGLLP